MRFWDASALVPLIVRERISPVVMSLAATEPIFAVWWSAEVECATALARLEREGEAQRTVAGWFADLANLARRWLVVGPGPEVRAAAVRLLRVHPLRSADALQLAAALVFTEHVPSGDEFVACDSRLRHAAAKEGFVVLPAEAS